MRLLRVRRRHGAAFIPEKLLICMLSPRRSFQAASQLPFPASEAHPEKNTMAQKSRPRRSMTPTSPPPLMGCSWAALYLNPQPLQDEALLVLRDGHPGHPRRPGLFGGADKTERTEEDRGHGEITPRRATAPAASVQ
jgi:hypothetical protein